MKDDLKKQRQELLVYTNGMILPSEGLMSLPTMDKIMIVQITPKNVIKKGPLGDYVPIGYIERCLNFVSNFRRGMKVQREGFEEGKSADGKKTVYSARCLADFYIETSDGARIERSCYGTWQMYKNPAVSKFVVMEAARSIATKSFADTLGIASDKLSKEFDSLREKREGQIVDGDLPEKSKEDDTMPTPNKDAVLAYYKKKRITDIDTICARLSARLGRPVEWETYTDAEAKNDLLLLLT